MSRLAEGPAPAIDLSKCLNPRAIESFLIAQKGPAEAVLTKKGAENDEEEEGEWKADSSGAGRRKAGPQRDVSRRSGAGPKGAGARLVPKASQEEFLAVLKAIEERYGVLPREQRIRVER